MELVFNAAIGGILIAFLIGGLAIAPETVSSDILGARGVPMLFAAIGLALLIASFFEGRRKKAAADPGNANPGLPRAGAVAVLLLAYILAVPFLGFALSTLVLSFLCIRVIGYKHLGKNALFSAALTALLVAVFGRVFFIALPRGIGLIKEISYFLY